MTNAPSPMATLDTGAIELIGRHCLIAELLADGIEAALPIRDRGVDLIAYLETHENIDRFYSLPIQLKVSSRRSFSLDKKYQSIRALLLVYVWGATGPEVEREFYAMSYAQAEKILFAMKYAATDSWKLDHYYATSKPSKKLIEAMKPYRMIRGSWAALVTKQAESDE